MLGHTLSRSRSSSRDRGTFLGVWVFCRHSQCRREVKGLFNVSFVNLLLIMCSRAVMSCRHRITANLNAQTPWLSHGTLISQVRFDFCFSCNLFARFKGPRSFFFSQCSTYLAKKILFITRFTVENTDNDNMTRGSSS